MSKDLHSEICVHCGINSVENLVTNRRNRFIGRHRKTDNYILRSNVVLIRFACVVLGLFNFCLLYLFSATVQYGEKVYNVRFIGLSCPYNI